MDGFSRLGRYATPLSATGGFLNQYLASQKMQFEMDKYKEYLKERQSMQQYRQALTEHLQKPDEIRHKGFNPIDLDRIRKEISGEEGEAGLQFETVEELKQYYNPQGDPYKNIQLDTFAKAYQGEEEERTLPWHQKAGAFGLVGQGVAALGRQFLRKKYLGEKPATGEQRFGKTAPNTIGKRILVPEGLEDIWDELSPAERKSAKERLARGESPESIKALLR